MQPIVIVTRPQPQADEWVARLRALGMRAQALPLLRIETEAAFRPAVQQASALLQAGHWTLVMFVSPNAVLQFFDAAGASLPAWPVNTWAAATGPGTVAALLRAGVPPGAIAQPRADAVNFDAEALWRDALAGRDWRDKAVLIVRGERGRDWLADTLRDAGARVQTLAAYRQCGPDWDATVCVGGASGPAIDTSPARQLRALQEAAAEALARPCWLFSSSQAIAHLVEHLDGQSAPMPMPAALVPLPDPRHWPVLATHERIASTGRAAGFLHVSLCRPDVAEVAALVSALATEADRYNPGL